MVIPMNLQVNQFGTSERKVNAQNDAMRYLLIAEAFHRYLVELLLQSYRNNAYQYMKILQNPLLAE